tara:strand:- start:701 stop:1804 length:1104 start_codon:yes stop_codon:yes gene_type:complete
MIFKVWRSKNIAKFIFIFFLLNNLSIDASTGYNFSKEDNGSIENNIKSQYLIGHGDELKIEFYDLKIYSGFYSIDRDGFIDLPEIGSFYVENLTIEELKKFLTEEYKKYIINPNIKINLVEYRPITIYISGEVRSPGIYTLKGNNLDLPVRNKTGVIGFRENIVNNFNIRLYDALKLAKGVNNYADLANVEIIRKNSKSQGGGKISTKIDLLSTLTKGDLSQNIRLYDGDYINIPKSQNIIKEQLLAINNLNINPEKITVYITGNVVERGKFLLNKGTSLTQAIASTGGKKLLTGNVEFLRFNDDGSIEKYKFRYNEKAKISTRNNPILMDGDIVNVKRTLFGETTEIFKEVGNPIFSLYGIYNIFK